MNKQRVVRGFTDYDDSENNKWVYGFGVSECLFSEEFAEEVGRTSDWLLYTDNGVYRVDPESIGWDIGLHDKNGKLIFDGDIWTKGEYNELVEFDTYYRNYRPFNNYSMTCNCYPYEDENYLSSRGIVVGNKYENENMISKNGSWS